MIGRNLLNSDVLFSATCIFISALHPLLCTVFSIHKYSSYWWYNYTESVLLKSEKCLAMHDNFYHWFYLHPDEMYEILSNLPESVAYTCINCTEQHPAEWRLALGKELQISLKQVLTALLNSRTTSHLLRYRQVSLSCSFITMSNKSLTKAY